MKSLPKLLDRIVILLILFAFAGFAAICLLRDNSSFTDQQALPLQENWTNITSGDTISLPASLSLTKNVPLTLQFTLPENSPYPYTQLYFSPYYYDLEVYLDDQPLLKEKFEPAYFSHTNGARQVFITLPNGWQGKELSMVITPQVQISSFKLAAPMLCFEAQIMEETYQLSMPSLVATNIIILFGVCLLVLYFVVRKNDHLDLGLLSLALFSLLCGIYLSTQLSWNKLIITNSTLLYIVEFTSHLLLPLPLLLLLENALTGLGRKIISCCLGLTLLHTIIQVLLFLLTDLELREMLLAAHLQLLLLSAIAAPMIVFGKFKQPGQRMQICISLVPIVLFSGIDVLVHYFVEISLPSLFLQIGFSVFIVLQAFFLIRVYLKSWEVEQRSKAYETLAYTDLLTGLKNRNAYESDAEHLDVMLKRNLRYNISCIAVDADNLKRTNDQEGHAAGDLLLQAIAEVLKKAFPKNLGIYRIGGDEFTILVTYRSKTELRLVLEEVVKNLAAHRFENHAIFSFSYGISDSTEFRTLAALTAQADAEMYDMKKHHRQEAGLID